MESVVIELQSDALNNNISVTSLLRKAYVVARKLRIDEFEKWLKDELDGYPENSTIPEYRIITGEVKAWNTYHGWQPIYFAEHKIAEAVSKCGNNQRIAEIENLLNSEGEKCSSLQIPFSAKNQNIICNAIGQQTQITLMTTESGSCKNYRCC